MDGDGDEEVVGHWGVFHPEDGPRMKIYSTMLAGDEKLPLSIYKQFAKNYLKQPPRQDFDILLDRISKGNTPKEIRLIKFKIQEERMYWEGKDRTQKQSTIRSELDKYEDYIEGLREHIKKVEKEFINQLNVENLEREAAKETFSKKKDFIFAAIFLVIIIVIFIIAFN